MPVLSPSRWGAGRAHWPDYDPASLTRGIVHFGPGAFHRAHQAHYFHRLLGHDARWGITGVSLRTATLRGQLRRQGGLYSVTRLGAEPQRDIVGALCDVLVASDEAGAVSDALAAPQTRLVTLTVTEKGYCLGPGDALDLDHPDIRADLATPQRPTSAIGWLVHGLRRRRQEGLAPFVTICCDNLADNGARLRGAVLCLAERQEPELARWIAAEAGFPATLVDSITPATDAALLHDVEQALGCTDRAAVQREPFTQWVVQDNAAAGDGPDWAAMGVLLARNVRPFAQAKLRMLNGAHSSVAYLGLLGGCRTVAQAMTTSWLAPWADLVMQDAAATLPAIPGLDLERYRADILQRFRNPGISHALVQIAIDGSQKLPIRLLATIADRLRQGRAVDRLCVPVAAWMCWVRDTLRHGGSVSDPLAGRLAGIAARCAGEPASDLPHFLALDSVFGPCLAEHPIFRAGLARAYAVLSEASGDAAALARRLDPRSEAFAWNPSTLS